MELRGAHLETKAKGLLHSTAVGYQKDGSRDGGAAIYRGNPHPPWGGGAGTGVPREGPRQLEARANGPMTLPIADRGQEAERVAQNTRN